MKEKILEEFDIKFHTHDGNNWPLDEEHREYYPYPDELKDFISQALDQYADWKIKEQEQKCYDGSEHIKHYTEDRCVDWCPKCEILSNKNKIK